VAHGRNSPRRPRITQRVAASPRRSPTHRDLLRFSFFRPHVRAAKLGMANRSLLRSLIALPTWSGIAPGARTAAGSKNGVCYTFWRLVVTSMKQTPLRASKADSSRRIGLLLLRFDASLQCGRRARRHLNCRASTGPASTDLMWRVMSSARISVSPRSMPSRMSRATWRGSLLGALTSANMSVSK
jgi:hypothetical protein